MNKRDFLAGAAAVAALPAAPSAWAKEAQAAPALLTVGGEVGKTNRGPLDKVRDQMMGKHGQQFSRAMAFTAADLQRMPASRFRVTLEYDGQPHQVSGPLVETVLKAAGVDLRAPLRVTLWAVDGYSVPLPITTVRDNRMIVATHLDGQPMALGGLGPQWAIHDADKLPAFKDKPLNERFASCPWGLYFIGVAAA